MMTRTLSTNAKTRPYFPELDGVRAVAALMVMLFHFGPGLVPQGLIVFGQTGVDLFFVLSGFLITTILLQAPPRDWHEIKNFYIRRTLRIFPLYYIFLIGYVLFGGVLSAWYWFYLQNVAKLGVQPFGPAHFWSLGVEEQFYLVWPFLVLFAPRRWLSRLLWGMVLLSFVLRVLLVGTHVSIFAFTPTRLDSLAAGGLLAFYFATGVLERHKRLLAGIGVAAVVSLVAEKVLSHGSGFKPVEVVKFTSSTALYSSGIGLLITTGKTGFHRVLSSRPMRAVGRVSYGLYVYHPFVFVILPKYLGNLPAAVKEVICFAAAYLVSLVSFYGFEKRFTDLKDKFAKEKKFKEVAA